MKMKGLALHQEEFHNRAHEYLAWMRRESPVYHVGIGPVRKGYLITRYDDVRGLLSGDQLVKQAATARGREDRQPWFMPRTARALLRTMIHADNPRHRRLRQLVQKAFTPRVVSALAPRIRELVEELCDACLEQGTVDVVEAFALPMPVRIIAELVGVPEDDLGRFQQWAHRIVATPTPAGLFTMLPAIQQFTKYIRWLAAKRRVEPQDDLISRLVQAEQEGDRLTEDELVGMVFLLLTAGHETTVSLIANGMRALLLHPDAHAQLRQDPALIPSAVEEMLRYDGPLFTTELYRAADDLTLHDVTIPRASIVLLGILSANRDESAFDDPTHFDITRDPNPHLAFGRGMHFCLGASLARLEASIAFEVLLERTKQLELAVKPEELRYHGLFILNKLKRLPVHFR
jgi:cytochrome P450 PksS